MCNTANSMIIRGDIYYADLSPTQGSEQGGTRPVLIIQNDTGNKYSTTVIAAAISSKLHKRRLPTHVFLSAQPCGLDNNSFVMLEQIRTLDKQRLMKRVGQADSKTMKQVDRAIGISFGLHS